MQRKRLVFSLIILIILGLGIYFLFLRGIIGDTGSSVLSEQQSRWATDFPEVVPEYGYGEIEEITVVKPEMSRFEDEVTALIEDTEREELDEYVEQLTEAGWIITYESPGVDTFYNIRLSLGEQRIGASINDEGVLRLNSYIIE